MSGCTLCDQIAQGKGVIGQNDQVAVMIAQEPAAQGHLLVVPKQHAPIVEQLTDGVVQKLFTTANALSAQLFAKLGIQGTNLLLQNGLAAGQSVNHVILNVLPRREGDGLNLEWQPKQIEEVEMAKLVQTLKAELSHSAKEKPPQPPPKKEETKKDGEKNQDTSDEIDYMIEQLKRIP